MADSSSTITSWKEKPIIMNSPSPEFTNPEFEPSTLEKAKNMAVTVAEKTKDAAGSIADKVTDAAGTVGEKVGDATDAVGCGMKSLAGTIREHLPHEGMLGSASCAVADTLESGGTYLQEEGLSGMIDDVGNLIRRNPMTALLAGVGIGFLLAKSLTRSSYHGR